MPEVLEQRETLDYKEILRLPKYNSYEEKLDDLDDLKTGKKKYPIIQGGKGLRISGIPSATAVTLEGGIGTLSGSMPGVDETYTEFENEKYSFQERKEISKANNIKEFTQDIDQYAENTGDQIRAANIMKAVADFPEMVKIAGESKKIDMLFVGAGPYRECAEHAKAYPHMQIIPIVSSVKFAKFYNGLTKNQQEKLGAVYLEHPFAGGHDGYAQEDDFTDEEAMIAKYDPQKLHEEISKVAPGVSLLLGGNGIATHEDVKEAYEIGFNGVVVGTMFAMAKESGFKDQEIIEDVILNEKFKTIVAKISAAPMPSTSVDNGFIKYMQELLEKVVEDDKGNKITAYVEYCRAAMKKCSGCIDKHCGLKKQQMGKERRKREEKGEKEKAIVCIAMELLRTLRGEINVLVFVGKVRDRAMQLPIFKDNDGNNRVPSTKEVYSMLAGDAA